MGPRLGPRQTDWGHGAQIGAQTDWGCGGPTGAQTDWGHGAQTGAQTDKQKHEIQHALGQRPGEFLRFRSAVLRQHGGNPAAGRLQQGRLLPRCPPGGALLLKKKASYNDSRIAGARDRRIEGSQALQGMLYRGSDTPWAAGPANFLSFL